MTSPGPARLMTPHLAVTTLAAVAGSLFGALLWRGQPFSLLTIVLVTIPLAVVIALAIAPEKRPRDSQASVAPSPRLPLQAPVHPAAPAAVPNANHRMVVPADPAGAWWEQPLNPAAPEQTIASPADLDQYRSSTRTVQCPGCGNFFVNVNRAAGTGYEFGCPRCKKRWQWAAGQAWPEVCVDLPNRGRAAP